MALAPRWAAGAVTGLALVGASAACTPVPGPAGLALLPATAPNAPAPAWVLPAGPAPAAPAATPLGAPVEPVAGPSSARRQPRAAVPPAHHPAPPLACPRSSGARVITAPGHGRTVALTFDDGPSAATRGVLAALAAEHVHATFFEIGSQVAADPAMSRRVARAGHLLGDHSWSHRYPGQVPGRWSKAFLLGDLRRTDAALTAATGARVCWFRPPGGFFPPGVAPAARELRLGVALWSVDTRDWADQTTSRIVAAALAGVGQKHPVVLMHDGGGPRGGTVAAVRAVIRGYRQHGYRFVRLDGES